MMNVDVDIYMNNMVKFFKSNPNDLLTLIPKDKEEDFYNKIREIANDNADKGNEPPLTQKQIIDICVTLNGKDSVKIEKLDKSMMETKFGILFLN